MKKIIFAIFLVLAICLVVFLLPKNQTPTVLKKVTVRLNWLAQAQYAGMYVAIEKGFYKDAGLEVKLEEYQDGLDQTKEVADTKVDFGISTPVELLTAINAGQKVRAIAAISQTSPEAIASLKKENIHSPSDFKGKILGAKGGNKEAKVVYESLMNAFSMSQSDVKVQDLDYSMDVADDLTNHRADTVDLYRTDEPFIFDKKGLSYNILAPEDYGFSSYGDLLITSDQIINAQPDMVKNFVQATIKGWQYAASHPDEALKDTKIYENKDYSDTGHEEYIFTHTIALIEPTGGGQIGDMKFVIWNKIAKELALAGLLNKNFDATTAYTIQFLQ